jgi:hypothetical protein
MTGACDHLGGTAQRTGAAQDLALPRTLSASSPCLGVRECSLVLVSSSGVPCQVGLGATYQEEGGSAIGEGEEAGHISAGTTAGC